MGANLDRLRRTWRALAHNMSWMLKKFHGVPTGERPDNEPRAPMSLSGKWAQPLHVIPKPLGLSRIPSLFLPTAPLL